MLCGVGKGNVLLDKVVGKERLPGASIWECSMLSLMDDLRGKYGCDLLQQPSLHAHKNKYSRVKWLNSSM